MKYHICSLILICGFIGYIVGMVSLSLQIQSEYQLNQTKLESYVIGRKSCNKLNATILGVYNYDCSRTGCGICDNQCNIPPRVDVDKYICFTLSIINEKKMIYRIPLNLCLDNVELSRISDRKNPWDNLGFTVGVVMGSAAWLVLCVVIMLYCKFKKMKAFNREVFSYK